ncbi:hypothetical protein TanjilG_13366 [Lupinus angustifolius]|uniref:Uncharacterized protein n=1 Tax=Lupinus angustifolius TaxID=3871 RepID=A0A4P1RUK1_LUPAN|nr:hypothetical protein TanjilG_13366 [Lupinus angustifolius]
MDGAVIGGVVFEIQGVTEGVVTEIGGVAAAAAADSGDEVGALFLETAWLLKGGATNNPWPDAVMRKATRKAESGLKLVIRRVENIVPVAAWVV